MRTNLSIILTHHLADGGDPFTALMTRDWASLGGWSLFLGFVIFTTYGAFREWWVPGARYRRLEESYKQVQEANAALIKQNDELLEAGKLTTYFFQEVLPRKTGVQP